MNPLLISTGKTELSPEIRGTGNSCEESDKVPDENVSYEYEGYQICVYFSGDKTLKQCIQNLAEQKIGY